MRKQQLCNLFVDFGMKEEFNFAQSQMPQCNTGTFDYRKKLESLEERITKLESVDNVDSGSVENEFGTYRNQLEQLESRVARIENC